MDKSDIITTATEIAEEYRDDYSLVLTLRQMYYQFVARGHLPNGDKVYKRIGSILGEARLDGSFPISFLEDRGRTVGSTSASNILTVNEGIEKVGDDLANQPFWLYYGRWYGQPTKVFVWIEKEALSGVLETVCKKLGVGLFPCKGYPSISALADWIEETYNMLEEDEDAVILYLGDHDPDGLQIPISAENTMRRIMDVESQHFDFSIDRIALTRAQIKKYNPPPMVAKKTSARYASYKRKTGLDDAWELDALDPPVLQKLVKDATARHFNKAIHADNQADATVKRVELIERVCDDPEWIERQLRRNV
tara:strand:+ start:5802 stop:6725 length:924 start_codon:yes stop_codon:yes gene_type:complete